MKLMLAPMRDITSAAFRNICNKYGADLTFSELVKIKGLARKDSNTWSRIVHKDSVPVVIQVLGSREQYFKKFLNMFTPFVGFEGFNLNLGCPDPAVINDGLGCAMVKRLSKVKKIISIFKDYGYNLSMKMRLGLNEKEKKRKVYLHMIEAADADFFIIHARHGAQGYDQPADFTVFEDCVNTGKYIVANGDIRTKEQLEDLKEIGVKGVMIGRNAVIDPTIFNKLKGLPTPPNAIVEQEYLELTEMYSEPLRYRKNVIKWFGKELDYKKIQYSNKDDMESRQLI